MSFCVNVACLTRLNEFSSRLTRQRTPRASGLADRAMAGLAEVGKVV
jgi:hypothetical protein